MFVSHQSHPHSPLAVFEVRVICGADCCFEKGCGRQNGEQEPKEGKRGMGLKQKGLRVEEQMI